MPTPPLWKASVALTKAEAHNVAAAFELTGPQAVLIVEDPFGDETMVEALYSAMPNGDLLTKLAGREVRVIILPDADWIKLSRKACRRCAPGASSSMARMTRAWCRMA